MSKKHKHPIEQKITEALQQEIRTTPSVPPEQLLQAVRKQKQSSFERIAQYQMPLWQTAAAVCFFMVAGHLLFPKIITQEKHFVQTEIQPSFICQTDTLIQIQEIEKIVHIQVPSNPQIGTPAIVVKNKINPMIDAIDNTAVMLNAMASTPPLPTAVSSATNSTTTSFTSSLGRNIQEDTDLMEFTIESEQFSMLPVQLKNK